MGAASAARTIKLGRYVVVKHLAQGGMADVLLARSSGVEGFERHVVIKRIRAEQARDAAAIAMFLDEARLGASLHHHNIVQVNDIGEEAGEYFFAMEYVHGEDARKLLTKVSPRREWIPIEHVITVTTGAAAGLHHAHEQRGADRKPLGIVHRDVSPGNIMIGYDGSVKVADFGIALAERRQTETQSGTLKGKVAYMSPEQCVGASVDRRSDVFSLGIVLYELVTTRRLFKGDDDFLTMTSIMQGEIPPPSQARPDIPPALEAIILKALANKPEDRYASCDELRIALERFADAAGVRTSTAALADYMKQQFGERLEPWLADDDEPDSEITVDVDGSGSASAVALPPTAALARPQTLPPTPGPRRRLGLLAGLGAVVAIGVALVVVSSGADSRDAESPRAARATLPVGQALPPAALPPAVPASAAPVVAPMASEPRAEVGVASVHAPTPTPRAVTIAPAPARPRAAKAPAKAPPRRWDPSALFPE